jgi:hypothetical protein
MSYCRLYALKPGTIHEVSTYKNAHGFCMFIWMSLSEKYLTGGPGGWMLDSQPLWNLATDSRLSDFERITHESTFDHVVIRVEDLDAYAQALDEFCVKYPSGDRVCHLPKISKDLREMDREGVLGIGWHGMSVSDDPWMIRSEEEDGEATMYDVTKRDEHWHLDFKKESVTVVSSVPELVDTILDRAAATLLPENAEDRLADRIREILYPGGDMEHEWSSNELDEIAGLLRVITEKDKVIPQAVKDEIDRHAKQGCPCGDFVTAVLDNDLKEAFKCADDYNIMHMREIVTYMYNHTPAACQGSKLKRRAWQSHNGLAGLSETPTE